MNKKVAMLALGLAAMSAAASESAFMPKIASYKPEPTFKFSWIGESMRWKNASLTNPGIEEITIEEAEKLLGKKIRR